MKIGIYGGTFDPPHNGHVRACQCFLEAIEMDKLYIIPTSIPPHKVKKSDVGGEERLEMAKLAFSGLSDKIEFSRVELDRVGKSYTSDTLKHFKALGVTEIYLFCGTDMFVTFDTWHEFEYIFDVATVVCMRRENDDYFTDLIAKKALEYKRKYNARLEFIDEAPIEVSSSDIRDGIAVSEAVQIPDSVAKFIKERGLYKDE